MTHWTIAKERAAAALFHAEHGPEAPWDGTEDSDEILLAATRERYRSRVRQVLDAIRENGFVIVRAKDHGHAVRNAGFQVYSGNMGKPNGMGMALEAMLAEAEKETAL